jgi:hypothetical protein
MLTGYIYDFVDEPEIFGCPVPCQQITYTFSVDYIYKNGGKKYGSVIMNKTFFYLEFR